ncbi:MAG: universal stress protein [Flavobacteriales bacterium]
MKKIIVPSDFTSVSEVAIRYATEIATSTGSIVHLLHIVKQENDRNDAQKKLEAQAAQHATRTGQTINTIVAVGNIFDDIPQVSANESAELIVMGTHGLHGMQYVVGSNALRVITESTVPMVIVQDGTRQSAGISKLLLPIDLHQETKQKLKIACDVAERFKAEVHLISPKVSDEFLHNKIERNVAYAEGYLEMRKIAYKTKVTDSGTGSFVKELLKYAQYAEIDLICILNTAEERLVHAFGVDSEQKIITNEARIPVMILNPAHTYVDSRSIFSQ